MAPSTLAGALALIFSLVVGHAVPSQHDHFDPWHNPPGAHHYSHGSYHHPHRGHTSSSSPSSTVSKAAPLPSAAALNPDATVCQVALPSNALTPEGLSTPWELLPPCSQTVSTQQAFAEAAIINSNGQISIYHPLIIDQGKSPQVAPVVPTLDPGSQIALFFGFNGDVLTLVDSDGQDTNNSPLLRHLQCVNGLPGVQGDVFGQVSWCNAESFWNAANSAVAGGQLQVPPLGNDDLGRPCPSSRSFKIVDQDQSDNLPTKYLLLGDGGTVQFTTANQAKFSHAAEIDNASDESLIADFVGPAIGCTPYQVDSIDDPGTKVSSLATQELQALIYQQEPIALIPLNDPDTLLTSSQSESRAKTNVYRIGVNMPRLGTGSNTDEGSPVEYCNKLIKIQPPFLASFQRQFNAVKTPDAGIGNNLFTFLCNRFLQSLPNLDCRNTTIPIKCDLDDAGSATACTISATHTAGTQSGTSVPSNSPAGNHSTPARPDRVRKARRGTIHENPSAATPWFVRA